jgi:hypothetical protein
MTTRKPLNTINETPKKGHPEIFTPEQVIEALTFTKGMRTKAAKRLRCTYNTVVRYINEYPEVAEAEIQARETMLDAVELKAYTQAMKGDTTMIIFMLKTQGKKRGYVERTEQDITSGGEKLAAPVVYLPTVADDASDEP